MLQQGAVEAGGQEWTAVKGVSANAVRENGQERDAGDFSQEEFQALLPKFGRRFARSPADDRLTDFVVEQIKRSGRALPRVHRFVVSRHGDHWVVSVLDVEALQGGHRGGVSISYHIGDRAGLRVLYEEAGI
jgi:hypothetical protein